MQATSRRSHTPMPALLEQVRYRHSGAFVHPPPLPPSSFLSVVELVDWAVGSAPAAAPPTPHLPCSPRRPRSTAAHASPLPRDPPHCTPRQRPVLALRWNTALQTSAHAYIRYRSGMMMAGGRRRGRRLGYCSSQRRRWSESSSCRYPLSIGDNGPRGGEGVGSEA